jgi:hypothetical protein
MHKLLQQDIDSYYKPVCDISGNNTICSYQSASFTASGGSTYLWSTGATSATISNLTAAGTYSVTVTAAGGCTSSCSRYADSESTT